MYTTRMNTYNARNHRFASPFAQESQEMRGRAVQTLLLATLITIGLYFVPYAGYITYPIRLLVTLIHEGSHALMAILTGGWVQAISIAPDGSGLTQSFLRGWLPQVLVASAGYLGATLYGTALIGLLRRGVSGSRLLFVTGVIASLVTLGIFGGLLFTGNVFGLFWGLAISVGLLLAAWRLPGEAAGWLAAFLGVQCVLNALFDLHTLFTLSVSTAAQTDAMNMARLTWVPAPVWAMLWIVTAFGMLYLVLRPKKG